MSNEKPCDVEDDNLSAKRKRISGGSFCAMGGCSNRSMRDTVSKRPGRNFMRFHRLPVDSALKKQWLCRMNRDLRSFTPCSNTRVCSEHFEDADYDPNFIQKFENPPPGAQRLQIRLLKDAIPNTDRPSGQAMKLVTATTPRTTQRSRNVGDISADNHQAIPSASGINIIFFDVMFSVNCTHFACRALVADCCSPLPKNLKVLVFNKNIQQRF